jgi:hypothetical protein
MYKSKSKVPKKGSAREEMTLAILSKFTNKLRSVPGFNAFHFFLAAGFGPKLFYQTF